MTRKTVDHLLVIVDCRHIERREQQEKSRAISRQAGAGKISRSVVVVLAALEVFDEEVRDRQDVGVPSQKMATLPSRTFAAATQASGWAHAGDHE